MDLATLNKVSFKINLCYSLGSTEICWISRQQQKHFNGIVWVFSLLSIPVIQTAPVRLLVVDGQA